ncbi:sigma-70 family RNA polymerase sigma factor [Phenylobacterium sp. LjRoot219]|uniref:sigma-70 family RNA polymerase sigma factor n=1 Tax=Phenylobacterium sp. LjRoot219 TaxID=3342283 RepID=UPI003ECD7902
MSAPPHDDVRMTREMLALAPKLRSRAWTLTRGRGDADDLVQETLLRAWQFRHTFHDGTNLKFWLYRILRNVFLADVAKPKAVQDVDGKFTARLAQEPDQEWRLRFSELRNGLAKLPALNGEALVLVAASGLTYDEAAAVLGCSAGTVKSRVNRARERLAETLDLEIEGPRHGIARPTRLAGAR